MTALVRVARAELVARTAREIEFVSLDGGVLPAVEPGAHVSVTTPAGSVRSYSVTEYTPRGGYVICVLRQDHGDGGSVSMHDDLAVGSEVPISAARNAFPLVEAESYLFIASGIGITPIRAMLRAVAGRAEARLVYLGRTAEETAYAGELTAHGRARVHYSASDGRYDLWKDLAEPDDRTHVYCCASKPLMERVRMLTMHWRPSRIHFEDFEGVPGARAGDTAFTAVWEPTGQQVTVEVGQSMLAALRNAGNRLDSSCESGTCGTCVLRLVHGAADHRDLVLAADQQQHSVMPCVSRALDPSVTVGPPS